MTIRATRRTISSDWVLDCAATGRRHSRKQAEGKYRGTPYITSHHKYRVRDRLPQPPQPEGQCASQTNLLRTDTLTHRFLILPGIKNSAVNNHVDLTGSRSLQ